MRKRMIVLIRKRDPAMWANGLRDHERRGQIRRPWHPRLIAFHRRISARIARIAITQRQRIRAIRDLVVGRIADDAARGSDSTHRRMTFDIQIRGIVHLPHTTQIRRRAIRKGGRDIGGRVRQPRRENHRSENRMPHHGPTARGALSTLRPSASVNSRPMTNSDPSRAGNPATATLSPGLSVSFFHPNRSS